MRRTSLIAAVFAVLLMAADREQDFLERSMVRTWLLDNLGEVKESRWWHAVDYGETEGRFVLKNFRVLRFQGTADGKKIDKVFVCDPEQLEARRATDWDEIKLNQPTAESWYFEMFEKIYPEK